MRRLPAFLAAGGDQRSFTVAQRVGRAVDLGDMAARLGGDQRAGEMIPGHQLGVDRELGAAGGQQTVFVAGASEVGADLHPIELRQNHLLQLLCLIAMDPPSDLSADSIRNEKVKVLKAMRRITPDMMDTHVVRGQYTAGTSGGKPVPGYLEEEGAARGSKTETFVALKAEIDNWRWSGVPFYIRTGKRLPEKLSQIIIHFKPAPHYIFDPDQKHLANNKLIIRLQPDEGMSLQILTKDQGLDKGMRLRQGPLELTFSETFETDRIPDAHERLLWEVMKGNQYLFVRRDEVEHAWQWVDQIMRNWDDSGIPPKRYAAGTWGPVASIAMITRDGRSWYEDA